MTAARLTAWIAFWLAAGLLVLGPRGAEAADRSPRVCLGMAEQRAAIAAGRAIPLAQVRSKLTAAVGKGRRTDIINARLCESPQGLVYVLTLLARNGKVSRVTVDAATGAVVRGR